MQLRAKNETYSYEDTINYRVLLQVVEGQIVYLRPNAGTIATINEIPILQYTSYIMHKILQKIIIISAQRRFS